MTPEHLFIERCVQVAKLITSENEVELLDLGARLRQLLLDQHSLANTVNKNKIKLQFRVNPMTPHGGQPPNFYQMEDGLDPNTSRPGKSPIVVDLEGFLKHIVSLFEGKEITIKDTIKFASNVAGGVHHDPKPKPEYDANLKASQNFGLGGYPAGVRQLKAIARVTMKALEPIIEDVKKRAN